jgi:hypothetical protein
MYKFIEVDLQALGGDSNWAPTHVEIGPLDPTFQGAARLDVPVRIDDLNYQRLLALELVDIRTQNIRPGNQPCRNATGVINHPHLRELERRLFVQEFYQSYDSTQAKEDNTGQSSPTHRDGVPARAQWFNCFQIKGEQPKPDDHK